MSEKEEPLQNTQGADPKVGVRFSGNLEDHPTVKMMAKVGRSWEESPSMKAIAAAARTWEESPSMRAIAAAARTWEESPSMKAIAAAARTWDENPSMKAIAAAARTWGENPSMKAIAAAARTWEESPSMKAIAAAARTWEESPSMKAIAAAARTWEENPSMKAIAAAARAWEESPSMKAIAAAARVLDKWDIPGGLTVDGVMDELAARRIDPEQPVAVSAHPQQVGEFQSSIALGGTFFCEVQTEATAGKSLATIPTWILLVWLYVLVPSLCLLVEWEAARASLVDLNARLPQTESVSGVRNFIRTELAGKPGDVRLVMGKDVNLRDGPGMTADVIMQLPRYAPVVVLGKEDRTWLFVSYEHEGYSIDGYVSTKFLRKVRK